MTAAKLISNYGGDAINIKAAIAKAVYVAGPKKGQAYSLVLKLLKKQRERMLLTMILRKPMEITL